MIDNPDVSIPSEIAPFRYWCQKVLPLTYDDSLSYYELLCKVVDYVNELISDVNTLGRDVSNLNDAFLELKSWVENYFDSTDFEQKINDKLDEMATDGTLYDMLEDLTTTIIPPAVTDWLNEHITPTSPLIDNSLTVTGAGADAKVTGDKFKMSIKSINLTLTTSNVPSVYPDLKSIEPASIIIVTGTASSALADSPYSGIAYYLITGKIGNADSTALPFQIAFPYNNNVNLMAIRTKEVNTQNYSSWQKLYKTIPPSTNSDDDRHDIIQYHLTTLGHVKLDSGTYYLSSNITMPDNSTLEGNGYDTKIVVKHKENTFNYGIQMCNYTTLKNLCIMGDTEVGDNPTTRPDSIYVYGVGWAGSTRRYGKIEGCYFDNLDHAGIVGYGTGTSVASGLIVTNCTFRQCYYGILISQNSEYWRISSSRFVGNHYGIMNRGGNNCIVNCGLDWNNVGIECNSQQGSNNGHGMIENCTINHSQPDNNGCGIAIRGSGGQMNVVGNNIYYSYVVLEACAGNVIANNHIKYRDVILDRDSYSLITGNMFNSQSHIYQLSDTASTPATTIINNNWRNNGEQVVKENQP